MVWNGNMSAVCKSGHGGCHQHRAVHEDGDNNIGMALFVLILTVMKKVIDINGIVFKNLMEGLLFKE